MKAESSIRSTDSGISTSVNPEVLAKAISQMFFTDSGIVKVVRVLFCGKMNNVSCAFECPSKETAWHGTRLNRGFGSALGSIGRFAFAC